MKDVFTSTVDTYVLKTKPKGEIYGDKNRERKNRTNLGCHCTIHFHLSPVGTKKRLESPFYNSKVIINIIIDL